MKLYDMSFKELAAGGPGSGRHAEEANAASQAAFESGKTADHLTAAELHMKVLKEYPEGSDTQMGHLTLAKLHLANITGGDK